MSDVVATGGDGHDGEHGDWGPDDRVELMGQDFGGMPCPAGPMAESMQGSYSEPAVEYAMGFVLQSASHRGRRAVFNPMTSGDVHQWDECLHGSHERAFISACQFLQEYFHARRNECAEWNREFAGEPDARLDGGDIASGGFAGGDAQGPFEAEHPY